MVDSSMMPELGNLVDIRSVVIATIMNLVMKP
jgi:hypothetical protein